MKTPLRWAAISAAALVFGGCAEFPALVLPPTMQPDEVRALQLGPALGELPDVPAITGGGVGFGEAERRTVRVRNVRCVGLGTGTGFTLDAHTVVTNRHVVEDKQRIELTSYDGRDIRVANVLVAEKADLAIVTTIDELDTAALLREDDPETGEAVRIVGFPEGGRMTVSYGTVLGFTEDPENAAFGQIVVSDAEIALGNSGSALLDDDGAIIGVVYAKTDAGWSMSIPVTTLRTLIQTEGTFTELPSCA